MSHVQKWPSDRITGVFAQKSAILRSVRELSFKMHHWCRQQGCVFDYRANQDSLRFSVIPLNVTFEDIYNFVHYLHTAWSNPDLKGAEKSADGFQKDYGVKATSNEDTMKAAY